MKSTPRMVSVSVLMLVVILPLSSWAGHRGSSGPARTVASVNQPEADRVPPLGYYTLDSLSVNGHEWTEEGYGITTQTAYDLDIQVTWHEWATGASLFDVTSPMHIEVLGMDLLEESLVFAEGQTTGTLSGILLYEDLVAEEGSYTAWVERFGSNTTDTWEYDLRIQNPPVQLLSTDFQLARDTVAVPVPSAFLLVGTGVAGVLRLRRRQLS